MSWMSIVHEEISHVSDERRTELLSITIETVSSLYQSNDKDGRIINKQFQYFIFTTGKSMSRILYINLLEWLINALFLIQEYQTSIWTFWLCISRISHDPRCPDPVFWTKSKIHNNPYNHFIQCFPYSVFNVLIVPTFKSYMIFLKASTFAKTHFEKILSIYKN